MWPQHKEHFFYDLFLFKCHVYEIKEAATQFIIIQAGQTDNLKVSTLFWHHMEFVMSLKELKLFRGQTQWGEQYSVVVTRGLNCITFVPMLDINLQINQITTSSIYLYFAFPSSSQVKRTGDHFSFEKIIYFGTQ